MMPLRFATLSELDRRSLFYLWIHHHLIDNQFLIQEVVPLRREDSSVYHVQRAHTGNREFPRLDRRFPLHDAGTSHRAYMTTARHDTYPRSAAIMEPIRRELRAVYFRHHIAELILFNLRQSSLSEFLSEFDTYRISPIPSPGVDNG